jgi:hypothetical protein
MSIFDTHLGARPAADRPSPAASAGAETGGPHPAGPLAQPALPGARPAPLCPILIDWGGLLDGARSPDDTTSTPIGPAPKPQQTAEETLAAIDAALRQNSARVTRHGLFDLESDS